MARVIPNTTVIPAGICVASLFDRHTIGFYALFFRKPFYIFGAILQIHLWPGFGLSQAGYMTKLLHLNNIQN